VTEQEQPGFDARLEWAAEGALLLARACPVLVVVDVLRFTTAVEVAVAHGARVVPHRWPGRGTSSLSPVSLLGVPPGTRLGVVAAGERRPDGSLRPAVEDLVGAGAILHALGGRPSPEARAAVAAFLDAAADLPATLAGCVSGRELAARGHAADLRLAAERDVGRVVPVLSGDAFAQLS
jgi:2-phosphosulfolactate phosphatase